MEDNNKNGLIMFDGTESPEIMNARASFYDKGAALAKAKDADPIEDQADENEEDVDDSSDTNLTIENSTKSASNENENSQDNEEDNDLSKKFDSLVELGYLHLPEDYKKPTTEEEFEEAIAESDRYRRQTVAKDLWNSLPEDGRELLEYMLTGGKDVKSFRDIQSKSLDLANIDLTDEEDQKKVLKAFYIRKGFTEEKAEKQVQFVDNLLELDTESKEAFNELKELDNQDKLALTKKAKEEKEKRERVEKERWQILNETLSKTEDFGGGYVIGKNAKPKALRSLYSEIELEDGSKTTDFKYRLNNVVLQDPKLTLVLSDILNRLEQDKKTGELYFNFSNLSKSAETKVTKGLKDKLDQLTQSTSRFKGGSASDGTKKGEFDWNSVL